jgi:glycosyltransferase involved in cell wall biosynthesis
MNSRDSLDIVLPVYNEEAVLSTSVGVVRERLQSFGDLSWRIVIAENGSTDRTLAIATELAERWPDVVAKHMTEKGRGRALRDAWLESDADYVCYMDIDLSTDLEAVESMVAALRGGCDLVVGSRLLRTSEVTRCLHREVLSRCYNALLKLALGVRFTDAQCGFKAARRSLVRDLVPLVESPDWFFDTELLYLAEKNGYAVEEIPVRWVEDPDTRVKILPAIMEDLRGILRLRFSRTRTQ